MSKTKRSFPTSKNLSYLFSKVPHDSFCYVVQFFERKEDFLNLCLVVKNLFNYISRILPASSKNVMFICSHYPKTQKSYVFRIRFFQKLEDVDKNTFSSNMKTVENIFPNLEYFLFWEYDFYEYIIEIENFFPVNFMNGVNLKVLKVECSNNVFISNFLNLEKISVKNYMGLFGRYPCLYLENVPKLYVLKVKDFLIKEPIPQTLRSFFIDNIEKLEKIERIPNLEHLSIKHCNTIKEIGFLDSLEYLNLGCNPDDCCKTDLGYIGLGNIDIYVTFLGNLKKLKVLRISMPGPGGESVPQNFNLRKIDVYSLKNLYFYGICVIDENEILLIENLNNIECIEVYDCCMIMIFKGIFRFLKKLIIQNKKYFDDWDNTIITLSAKFDPGSFVFSKNIIYLEISNVNFNPPLTDEKFFIQFKKLKELVFKNELFLFNETRLNVTEKPKILDPIFHNLENLKLVEFFDFPLFKIENCPKLKFLTIYFPKIYNYKETDSFEISERLNNLKSLTEIKLNAYYHQDEDWDNEQENNKKELRLFLRDLSKLRKIIISEEVITLTMKNCLNLEVIEVKSQNFILLGCPKVKQMEITLPANGKFDISDDLKRISVFKWYFSEGGFRNYEECTQNLPYLKLPFSIPHFYVSLLVIRTYCRNSVFSKKNFPNLKYLKLIVSKDNDIVRVLKCDQIKKIHIYCYNKKEVSIFCESLPILESLKIKMKNEGVISGIKLSNLRKIKHFELFYFDYSDVPKFGKVKLLRIENIKPIKNVEFSGINFCEIVTSFTSKYIIVEKLKVNNVINFKLNKFLCSKLSIGGIFNYKKDISDHHATELVYVSQKIEEMVTNYSNLSKLIEINTRLVKQDNLDTENKKNYIEKNLTYFFRNLINFTTFKFEKCIFSSGIEKFTLNFKNCENFSKIYYKKNWSQVIEGKILCKVKDSRGNCCILKSGVEKGSILVHPAVRERIDFKENFIIEIELIYPLYLKIHM